MSTMAHMIVFHNKERGWFTINGVGWTDDEPDPEHGKEQAKMAAAVLGMVLKSEVTDEIYDVPVNDQNIVQYPDAAKHLVSLEYGASRRDLEVAFIRGPWYDQCPPEMRKPYREHEAECTCFWCMNPGVTEASPEDIHAHQSARKVH